MRKNKPLSDININCYFQSLTNVNLKQLRMTPISVYSSTPWREANFITRTILNFYNGHSPLKTGEGKPVITDATSCVGCNTVSLHLSQGFKQVNSIEIDPDTCQMLINNLKVYHLPTDHVHCCDYLSIYKKCKQDVIFIDPPWGGPHYMDTSCLDLYLSNINIIDICFDIITNKLASLIVLKLPVNYNLPRLINKLPNNKFLTHKIYRGQHHSYNVVFCW
jgi:NAD-dependent dihydropyrimidine dehydrogenase PreA subunit